MPSFFIENFGCRATDADASAIRLKLQADGWTRSGTHEGAELVVLNTCTVTSAADAQAREAVRKIHRANPGARIIVTGCYAQRAPEEIAELQGVSAVVGNTRQNEIPRLARGSRASDFVPLHGLRLDETVPVWSRTPVLSDDFFAEAGVESGPAEAGEDGSTRPILKVQDGCNNRCSFCIIPTVRGRSRSLHPDSVLETVRRSVSGGARELVLSGINLGSYGRDLHPKVNLVELVQRVLDETALEQLRFSSIEPQHVTEDFARLVASSGRIAQHFHIPLQSGSDSILRAMRRWYRTAHYAERARRIHAMLPDAAIGADVIAGFPGESEVAFDETIAFIREMPLSYLHVFSYSARPGTEAAQHEGGALPGALIRERARALRAIGAEKASAFRVSQAGKPVRALTLGRGGENWTEAITGNYLKARIAGCHAANEWHFVQPTAHPDDLLSSRRPD